MLGQPDRFRRRDGNGLDPRRRARRRPWRDNALRRDRRPSWSRWSGRVARQQIALVLEHVLRNRRPLGSGRGSASAPLRLRQQGPRIRWGLRPRRTCAARCVLPLRCRGTGTALRFVLRGSADGLPADSIEPADGHHGCNCDRSQSCSSGHDTGHEPNSLDHFRRAIDCSRPGHPPARRARSNHIRAARLSTGVPRPCIWRRPRKHSARGSPRLPASSHASRAWS